MWNWSIDISLRHCLFIWSVILVISLTRTVLGGGRAETRLNEAVLFLTKLQIACCIFKLKSGMEVKTLKSRANSRIEKAQTKRNVFITSVLRLVLVSSLRTRISTLLTTRSGWGKDELLKLSLPPGSPFQIQRKLKLKGSLKEWTFLTPLFHLSRNWGPKGDFLLIIWSCFLKKLAKSNLYILKI